MFRKTDGQPFWAHCFSYCTGLIGQTDRYMFAMHSLLDRVRPANTVGWSNQSSVGWMSCDLCLPRTHWPSCAIAWRQTVQKQKDNTNRSGKLSWISNIYSLCGLGRSGTRCRKFAITPYWIWKTKKHWYPKMLDVNGGWFFALMWQPMSLEFEMNSSILLV